MSYLKNENISNSGKGEMVRHFGSRCLTPPPLVRVWRTDLLIKQIIIGSKNQRNPGPISDRYLIGCLYSLHQWISLPKISAKLLGYSYSPIESWNANKFKIFSKFMRGMSIPSSPLNFPWDKFQHNFFPKFYLPKKNSFNEEEKDAFIMNFSHFQKRL